MLTLQRREFNVILAALEAWVSAGRCDHVPIDYAKIVFDGLEPNTRTLTADEVTDLILRLNTEDNITITEET
jgi:hypothetical protein